MAGRPPMKSRMLTALADCAAGHGMPLTHPQVDLLARTAAHVALRLDLETEHTHSDGTLTATELTVLRMTANGVTDAEIAKRAARSTTAIHGVVQRIVRNLGAANRTHAVAIAVVRGLLKPGEIRRQVPISRVQPGRWSA